MSFFSHTLLFAQCEVQVLLVSVALHMQISQQQMEHTSAAALRGKFDMIAVVTAMPTLPE